MSVTLGNLGAGSSLVGTPSTTTLATKGVAAGSGIAISTSSTDVTLSVQTSSVCIIRNSAPVNYANGSATTVLFDTEVTDPSDMHSTSVNTGRINILSAGIYQINAGIVFSLASTPATDLVYAYLYRNASGVGLQYLGMASALVTTATNRGTLTFSRLASLAVNDYLYLQFHNASGVQATILGASSATNYYASPVFQAIKVSN